VKFHDGTPFTSADVKASLERMSNPPVGVVSVRRAMFEDIVSVETPNPLTAVVNLKSPNVAMLQLLGTPYACIYSSRLLASDPLYPAKKVMGTGPFRFVSHTAGQDWIGERFEGYFKPGQPYLDGYRALNTTQPGALNALLAGQVHYTMQGQTPGDVERLRASRGDKLKFVGGQRATGLHILIGVNTQRGALADVRVRRALLLAMDRYAGSKAMANLTAVHLPGGFSRPGSVFARSPKELETLPGFSRDIAASRKEARRLLADSGHSNLKISFVNRPQSTYWGVFLADQMRQIGVTLDHQVSDNVNGRKVSGDYDLIVEATPEYLDDPIVQWSTFLPYDKNPANVSRTNDPKLEGLYNAQKGEQDPAKRHVLVQEMEKYMVEQAYFLPMFWQSWRRGISVDLGGVGDMPSNFLNVDLSRYWLRSGGAKSNN
jgi:peptide/nickel transport system substrate-binding protein